MPDPALRSIGAVGQSDQFATNFSPGAPAGTVNGDRVVLLTQGHVFGGTVTEANTPVLTGVDTGAWTLKAGGYFADTAGNTRRGVAYLYELAGGVSGAVPTVTLQHVDDGNTITAASQLARARMFAFSDSDGMGPNISTNLVFAQTANPTCPAITVTRNGSRVCAAVVTPSPRLYSAQLFGGSATGVSEDLDETTTLGGDGATMFASKTQAVAGTSGEFTATQATTTQPAALFVFEMMAVQAAAASGFGALRRRQMRRRRARVA